MRTKLLSSTFLLLFLASTISAQDYAVALKISTLGAGAEVIRSFGEDFNVRAGFAYLTLSLDGGGGSEDYAYTAESKLTSISALVDYFPFESSFRLSGGLLFNLNSAVTVLTPTKSYTIGNDVYSPEKLGTLEAEVKFAPVAPYFGLGFGNPTGGDSGFGVTFDIGTMYHGAPQVNLTAEGLLEPSAAPDQEELIESNLNEYKWYPALTFGLNYKF